MITGTLLGSANLIAKIKKMPDAAIKKIQDTVKMLGFELQARVQRDKLSGQVLKAPTGRLRASINPSQAMQSGDSRSRYADNGTQIYYYVGTNVEYAATWEYGTASKTILPINGKALKFVVNGMTLFRKRVTIPALAARPFLAPTLEEMRPLINEQLGKALKSAMEETVK